MQSLLVAIAWVGLLGQESRADAEPIASYLYQPSYCMDKKLRAPAEAYLPRPGDIMLATDDNLFWKITHDLALAFEPHGSGIFFERSSGGGVAILEAGPNDTLFIRNLDALPHLVEYANKGPVWVRKHRLPLTDDQSAKLTAFAECQNGKWFALPRLGLQLTPFRARGPLRTYVMGKSNPNRISYYCSELVTEAMVAADLLDRDIARPSATYPHDLFFEHSFNLYIDRHYHLGDCWHPPARWTYCP
jgi:hypothetical protein